MCWLLAVVAALVLVAVGQPHQLLLLLLAAVAAVVEEELNYGFLPYLLAPLRQSLLALVVLAALPKQQTILTEMQDLMDQIHRLGLGHLPEVGLTVLVVHQFREALALVVVG